MSEASTDHGTVLKPGTWAIIWTEEHGFSLLTPRSIADRPDGTVHEDALALTGALVRLDQEAEFRDECRRFFMSIKA